MLRIERTAGASSNASLSQQRRRRVASWSSLLFGALSLVLLLLASSASVVVYRWARAAVRAQPMALGSVELAPLTAASTAAAADQPANGAVRSSRAPRAALPASPSLPWEVTIPRQRITVLLLGVDQRPDDPSPPRTDNMMVVTADLTTGRVGIISLPRDLFVPIPGFDRSGKINTAYVVGESNKYPGGGGALAMRTVSELLGYPIDYYVKINFDGFVRLVDTLGGIEVEVPKTIHDEEYPTMDYGITTFHIDAGWHHMDGETALKYVRTRHADSDFERARRQQQVLLAIKDRVMEQKLLTSLKIFDLIDLISSSVEHNIPAGEMLDLVALAARFEVTQVDQLVLDTAYGRIDADSPYGWIIVPDRTKIRPAVDRIFGAADALASAPATEAAAQPQPAVARLLVQPQVLVARQHIENSYAEQAEALRTRLAEEGARVVLQDGAGDPVLLARAADWLTRQGYQIVATEQADRQDYNRTVLDVLRKKPFTVASLRNAFAIAPENIRYFDASDSSVDLRLIIGRDFYLLVSN
ncbi:MAG: LCP family protein [Caldilineales bacterium]|nr:LCP family protein [Caldilineales bacterium]MDW8316337.1 LCP family protein [Anaerolineae bacterium]